MTKKELLIEYIKVKLAEGDYHAVSDAANDLRVLEAREDQPKWIVEAGIEVCHKIINNEENIVVSYKK